MKIPAEIRQLLSLSPGQAIKKITDVAARRLYLSRQRKIDAESCTFSQDSLILPPADYFELPGELPLSEDQYRHLLQITGYFLDHRFDLLGSGWVRNTHGMKCRGVEGYRYSMGRDFSSWEAFTAREISPQNRAESLRIANLISADYTPVDWQIDFKSGFRWNASTWYRDIRYGEAPGADIKVPAELGQFQHAPSLALAAHCHGEKGFLAPELYAREFQDQVLDFIASNPPRFGVQWLTAMDAAIRTANWLVSYELFRRQGIVFPASFEEIFGRSIYEHARHISTNLEWASGMRANHFIGDICGLAFCATYLPLSPESSDWLRFAVHELNNEVLSQFLEDGGNFEASTSYHRLCLERAVWTSALILALPDSRLINDSGNKELEFRERGHVTPLIPDNTNVFSATYFERIYSALGFTYSLQDRNGEIPQIGDNDNNRFLRFTPDYRELSRDEAMESFTSLDNYVEQQETFLLDNINGHGALLAAGCALLGTTNIAPSFSLEYSILSGLLKKRQRNIYHSPLQKEKEFKNFGLFLLENENINVLVRCGPIGQYGKGGHAHNDQLSFELSVKGRKFLIDPGTYIYSGLPAKRNLFRSTEMHNTLQPDGQEQNAWPVGSIDSLFWYLGDRSRAECLEFSEEKFLGQHYGFSEPCTRGISLSPDTVLIEDSCTVPGPKKVFLHLSPDTLIREMNTNSFCLENNGIRIIIKTGDTAYRIEDSIYSPGYGIIRKSSRIILLPTESTIRWSIHI